MSAEKKLYRACKKDPSKTIYEHLKSIRNYDQLEDSDYESFDGDCISEDIQSSVKYKIDRDYEIENVIFFRSYLKSKMRCINDGDEPQTVTKLAFDMATGSGKGLLEGIHILESFKMGYNCFLVLTNSQIVIDSNKNRLSNPSHEKYTFNNSITINGKNISISAVDCFPSFLDRNTIYIKFSTIQQLLSDLKNTRENNITIRDLSKYPLVVLYDEAHHINASTKSNSLDDYLNNIVLKSDGSIDTKKSNISWEQVVETIVDINPKNILLEYTATLDLDNINIRNKYIPRIIYEYNLKKFREDGYSKNVELSKFKLGSEKDIDFEERKFQIELLTLISSEYKKYLFNNGLNNFKVEPKILFKSKGINASINDREMFYSKLEKLSFPDYLDIISTTASEETKKLDVIKSNQFFERLKNFKIENSIIINSKTKKDEKKKLEEILNNLDSELNNRFRVIWVADMLNEGWDVLSLFDICKLYPSKKVETNSTISEKQLIGRGCRLYPFEYEGKDKYKIKFDFQRLNNLYKCEVLTFHCDNDKKYIDELHTELIKEGFEDESAAISIERTLTIKDTFRNSEFFKNGNIYLNELNYENQTINTRSIEDIEKYLKSLNGFDLSLSKETITTFIETNSDYTREDVEYKELSDILIPKNLIYQALVGNQNMSISLLPDGYNYPILSDFISKIPYTARVFKTTEKLTSNQYINLSIEIVSKLTNYLNDKLSINVSNYQPVSFESILDKIIEVKRFFVRSGQNSLSQKTEGQDYYMDLSINNLYAYNDNYGTSDEKYLVKYILENVPDNLEYFYLFRNEEIFSIYNENKNQHSFKRKFQPDFILFYKELNSYEDNQIFIECKGSDRDDSDENLWKEKYLTNLNKKINNTNIKGLPFFTIGEEEKFKRAFRELFNI